MVVREWTLERSSRGSWYQCCRNEHVSLEELKEDPSLNNDYLSMNNIPRYPSSVLFKVKNVCHDTVLSGLQGIYASGGLQAKDNHFLWLNLLINEDNIAVAESKWLESLPPWYNRCPEPFLEKFTTSPAFQKSSRYGNFRFTFCFKELLRRYSRQFCNYTAPVLRVLDTRLYKQEIMYTILVHPKHIIKYKMYPRLPLNDMDVCGYFGPFGKVSWTCQSPTNIFNYRLQENRKRGEVYALPLRVPRYFVWDHVSFAFHMEEGWTLEVYPSELVNKVSVCSVDQVNLLRNPNDNLSLPDANAHLQNLKRRIEKDYQW